MQSSRHWRIELEKMQEALPVNKKHHDAKG